MPVETKGDHSHIGIQVSFEATTGDRSLGVPKDSQEDAKQQKSDEAIRKHRASSAAWHHKSASMSILESGS